jgi:hypothetical protein
VTEPEDAEDAPTEAEVRATCERYSWRYHRRCRGRGWILRDGQIAACACAMKRALKRLVAAPG